MHGAIIAFRSMMLAPTTCMVPRVGCAIPPPAAEPSACGSPVPARFISRRTRTSTSTATRIGVTTETRKMTRTDVPTRAGCRRCGMLRYVGFVVALVLLVAGWLAIGPWIFAVLLVALLVPATRRRMRPNRWLLGGSWPWWSRPPPWWCCCRTGGCRSRPVADCS